MLWTDLCLPPVPKLRVVAAQPVETPAVAFSFETKMEALLMMSESSLGSLSLSLEE